MKAMPSFVRTAALTALMMGGAAQASTVEYAFGQVISFSGTPGGSAQWLDLIISGTATPGTTALEDHASAAQAGR